MARDIAASAWRTSVIGSVSASQCARATPTLARSGTTKSRDERPWRARFSVTSAGHGVAVAAVVVTQHDEELVAAQPTDNIADVGGVEDGRGGGGDGSVTELVTVVVVELLEPVEVHEQHGHCLPACLRRATSVVRWSITAARLRGR